MTGRIIALLAPITAPNCLDITYADFCGREVLRTIYAQTQGDLITRSPWTQHLAEEIQSGQKGPAEQDAADFSGKYKGLRDMPGKYFNKLSPDAFNTLIWMASPKTCFPGEVLFREDDLQMESVYLLLDGKVKLSISAPDGRNITCTVAKRGDILGLASALSGAPAEMTAETLECSMMAQIWKKDFTHFLLNHRDAYEAVVREVREDLLSAMHVRRTVGSDEAKFIE